MKITRVNRIAIKVEKAVESWKDQVKYKANDVVFVVKKVCKTIEPLEEYSNRTLSIEEKHHIEALIQIASELVDTISKVGYIIWEREDFKAAVENQIEELEQAVQNIFQVKEEKIISLSENDVMRELKQDTDFLRNKFPSSKTTGALL